MTPRIDAGAFSNVYDKNFAFEKHNEGTFKVSVSLYDINGNQLEGGAYDMDYVFGEDSLTIDIVSQSDGEYVLPLIAMKNEKVLVGDKGIEFE